MKLSRRGRSIVGITASAVIAITGEALLTSADTSTHTAAEESSPAVVRYESVLGQCSLTGARVTAQGLEVNVTVPTDYDGAFTTGSERPRAIAFTGKNTFTQSEAHADGYYNQTHTTAYSSVDNMDTMPSINNDSTYGIGISKPDAAVPDVTSPHPFGLNSNELIDCGTVTIINGTPPGTK